MNNEDIFKQAEIEDIEIQIYEARIKKAEQQLAELSAQTKFKQDQEQKFFSVLSQKLNLDINKDNIENFYVPENIWGETLDEILNKQNDLIKPSHSLLPYSIIQQEPILEEYLPYQSKKNGLAVLLDQSTSRAMEIINEFTSDNTEKAHRGDLVYFHAWLSAIGFNFNNPISENELLKFAVDHAEGLNSEVDKKLVEQGFKSQLGPHKLSTIKRRIASLSVFLDKAKWPNPCRNKAIKELLAKLTKKYGGSKPAGKAITKDILDDMLETTSKNKLIDIRDRALLLFAWASGGRRRSEVAAAEFKNLIKTPEGDYLYTMTKSKTDQEEKGHVVPIKGRAAKALSDWLEASNINEGKIFRGVSKGEQICDPIADVDVYRIVRRRLKKAGYDETHYGAHSLRSGFVTEAGRKNKNLGDVMQMTTHRSVATIMKYYQSGNIINNSASNLAD